MYRSGTYVAEHVSPTTDEQVQPNGVDLTLEAVHEQRAPGRISRDGKEIGARRGYPTDAIDVDDGADEGDGSQDGSAEPSPDEIGTGDDPKAVAEENQAAVTYTLPPGGYVIQYGEVIAVPDGHLGFVYPRSSLLRNSSTVNTAVWDTGYEGRGEGLLQVHHEIQIEAGARVAQFVLAEADHEGDYDGSYQGENL